MSSIVCRGITRQFGTTTVLDDLDLEVPDGTVVTSPAAEEGIRNARS